MGFGESRTYISGLRKRDGNIFFRVARWIREDEGHYSSRWMIQRRRLPDGWIVALRLGEHNSSKLDYLLVPTTGTERDTIRFTEKTRDRLGIVRFETSDALVRSVNRRARCAGQGEAD
jgi:hypothetical protein